MTFSLVIAPAAQKQLAALDKDIFRRLDAKILALADNPRPHGVVKLTGPDELWRVRVGDWRIVYTIQDRELIVLIVKVGHRRDIYR